MAPVTQAQHRRGGRMDTLWQDVKFSARTLASHRGMTIAAVLTLALGIGANTAVFSVVNAVLLRPLPYAAPERLTMVWEGRGAPVSPANFLDWRSLSQAFEGMAALDFANFNLTGAGEPERLRGARVSAEMFRLLGVQPLVGRWFRADEDHDGAARVVMLGHGLWQRRFGGQRSIVGGAIALNGEAWTVVGIMPPGFDFPSQLAGEALDLWVPIAFPPAEASERGLRRLGVLARLKSAVSLDDARTDMQAVGRRLAQQYPRDVQGGEIAVVPLRAQLVRGIEQPMWVLLGAVGFVLLISCANVANLLLTRAVAREREMAVRVAIGAGPWRLIRQLLVECVLLSLVGGALALVVALWGTEGLARLLPDRLPRVGTIDVDVTVLLFTLSVSLATGVLFGLVPSTEALKRRTSDALRQSGRGDVGGRGRLRNGLVVGEVALALTLLTGAGLLAGSFYRLSHVDPGFDARNVLTADLALSDARYPEEAQRSAFIERTLENLVRLPGVESVGVAFFLPLGGGNAYFDMTLEGSTQAVAAYWRVVSSGYFETMRIPLLRGRDFTPRDLGVSGVAIVSESMARQFWPGQDPIGRRLKVGLPDADEPWLEIVGVVGDVLHRGLATERTPELYVPYAQSPSRAVTLVVRTAAGFPVAGALRKEIAAADPLLPVADVSLMEEVVARSVAPQRFRALLLLAFAAMAALLAWVGVYGVMACRVAQRAHEIGIRVALGAGARDIFRSVIGEGMKLTAGGLAAGLACATVLMRLLRHQLFGVEPTDPWTLAAVAFLLAVAALLACCLPARRAMRADPLVALRRDS
jgi:putative ABC transport system permease protein